MSMQPQPWPQPAQEIVVAVRAMYARRRAPLPVQVVIVPEPLIVNDSLEISGTVGIASGTARTEQDWQQQLSVGRRASSR